MVLNDLLQQHRIARVSERKPMQGGRKGGQADLLDLGLDVLGHDALGDLLEEGLLLGLEVLLELGVPSDDRVDGDGVEQTVDTGVDQGDHDLDRDGPARRPKGRQSMIQRHERGWSVGALVLALLEELGETRSTGEQEAGRGVEVRAELAVKAGGRSLSSADVSKQMRGGREDEREGGNLTVLSEVEL